MFWFCVLLAIYLVFGGWAVIVALAVFMVLPEKE